MHFDDLSGAARAAQSLELLRELVVIADTGSEQAIREQLPSLGLPVIDVVWDGSYSSLVNQAIDQVRADAIFRMDADEYLLDGHAELLEPALRSADPTMSGWVWRKEKLPGNEFFYSQQGRLLWKSRGDRYFGLVHERILSGELNALYPKHREVFLHAVLGHNSDYFLKSDPVKYRRLIEEEVATGRGDRFYHRCMLPYLAADRSPDYVPAVQRELDYLLSLPRTQAIPEWGCMAVLEHVMDCICSRQLPEDSGEAVVNLMMEVAPACESTLYYASRLLAAKGSLYRTIGLLANLKSWIRSGALLRRTYFGTEEFCKWCDDDVMYYREKVEERRKVDDLVAIGRREADGQDALARIIASIRDGYKKDHYDVFPDQHRRRAKFDDRAAIIVPDLLSG